MVDRASDRVSRACDVTKRNPEFMQMLPAPVSTSSADFPVTNRSLWPSARLRRQTAYHRPKYTRKPRGGSCLILRARPAPLGRRAIALQWLPLTAPILLTSLESQARRLSASLGESPSRFVCRFLCQAGGGAGDVKQKRESLTGRALPELPQVPLALPEWPLRAFLERLPAD